MAFIDLLKKPIAKLSTAEVERELIAARSAVTAADSELVDAEKHYQVTLLDDDPEAPMRAREAIGSVIVRRDRAMARIEVLTQRLREVRARDEAAAMQKAYADAKVLADAAVSRFRKEYHTAAATIVALVTDMVTADVAVRAANAALPPDADPLTPPEAMVRGVQAMPRKVVSEKVVTRWVFPTTGAMVSPDLETNIRCDGDTHVLCRSEANGSTTVIGTRQFAGQPVEQRQFREIKFLPEVAGDPALPMVLRLCLPGLHDRADLFSPMSANIDYTPFNAGDMDRHLAALRQAQADFAAPVRVPRVEYQPMQPTALAEAAE